MLSEEIVLRYFEKGIIMTMTIIEPQKEIPVVRKVDVPGRFPQKIKHVLNGMKGE